MPTGAPAWCHQAPPSSAHRASPACRFRPISRRSAAGPSMRARRPTASQTPRNLVLSFDGAGIAVNGGSATLTNNGYLRLQQFELGRRRDPHQQRLPVFQQFQHGRQRQLHQQLHCRLQQLQLAWQRHRHQQLLSPDPQHQLGRQRQHHQRQRRQPDLRWNQHRR